MSKLWNYLTGKQKPEPIPTPVSQFQRPSSAVLDFHSAVQLRTKLDKVPNYRHPFTEETDIDHYKLFSLFHHFPALKTQWEGIVAEFIANKGLVKAQADSVCHHRLRERVSLFAELFAGLGNLSQISNMVPYSLVHLLLVTMQDIMNQSLTSTIWQYPDPFQLLTCIEETKQLSSELFPMLGLIEYFISKDESALLLGRDFLGLYLDYIRFLSEKVELLANHSEETAEEFLKLYYYALHCLFALGKLHKTHEDLNEDSHQLLVRVMVTLREAARRCYKGEDIRRLVQAKRRFYSQPESHIFARFSLGDREKFDLNLTILKYLTKLSKGVPGLDDFLLPFLMETVLPDSVSSLLRMNSKFPMEDRDLVQCLIFFEMVQSVANTEPEKVKRMLQTHQRVLQESIRAIVWSSFDWTIPNPSSTYHSNVSPLERLFCKIDRISLLSFANTDAQTFPFSLFDFLLSEDMETRAIGHFPLPQAYILEFIACYTSVLKFSSNQYLDLIRSNLLKVMFSPLIFVIPEDPEVHFQQQLVQTAAAYTSDIFKIVLSQAEGKLFLIQSTIQAMHMNKHSANYENQVTSLLFFLLSERDDLINQDFADCQIADNIYQIIQELRVDRVRNKAAIESLEMMLIKLLEMPEISSGVIKNEAFLDKFMNEQLFSPESSEFCIQCVSNLMRLSDSEYLYKLFVLTLKQVRDEEMFKWLIQGIERTVKGSTRKEACQKEFVDADLLNVLIDRLDSKGTLSLCSMILPTLRVILEGNPVCKSSFTRLGLSKLQQVLARLLSQDLFPEAVLDNLLFILFESDDLSKSLQSIRYPEIAPLVLDLVTHVPDINRQRNYINTFAQMAEAGTENRFLLSQHRCISPLLTLLSNVLDPSFRMEVLNLITVLCLQHLSPGDFQAIVNWVAKDTANGALSREGKNLIGSLAASCRYAVEPLLDQKRPLPKAYFSFSGGNSSIQVSADKGNPTPFFSPGKGFSVFVWIRPVINPEAMFFNVFSMVERNNCSVLNMTASGALQFMISEGEKQLFEAVTESEKLTFDRWNFVAVTCAQRYGKKDDFAIYINDVRAEYWEIRPSRFPKEMYSTLWIGGNHLGDSFFGQMSTFYLFSSPASPQQISDFYALGSDYEGLLQSEEIVSERIRALNSVKDLRSSLILCLSPRYRDLKGRILDASPVAQYTFDPVDVRERQKRNSSLKRSSRCVKSVNVTFITTTRTPEALSVLGGPALLLPLLYRVKDKEQVMELMSEVFYMTAELFLIPSYMTVRAVCKDGLCEFIRMSLEDLGVKQMVDPGLIRCIVRMVDSLEWNHEARHHAFFKLLYSFRFWAKLDWELQKDIIGHIFRLLSLVRTDSDPSPLFSALSLLRTYFSTSHPLVDRDQLPTKRLTLLTMVQDQLLLGASIEDRDMSDLIENLVFVYSYSRDDLSDFANQLHFLFANSVVKLNEDMRESFNKAMMFVIRKCGKKGLTELQESLIGVVQECYLSSKCLIVPGSIIQKQFSRVIRLVSERSMFTFQTPASLFEVLNCMLPRTLTRPVYSSLLRILTANTDTDLSIAQLKHPAVLDLITTRVSDSPCASDVFQDLKVLGMEHTDVIYGREVFPAWLLQLFIYTDEREEATDRTRNDLLFSLCKTLFSNAFLSLPNPGIQFRTFVFTFLNRVSSEIWKWKVLYRVLEDVVESIELGLAAEHAAMIGKDVYYNLHDFAYILEDICQVAPQFPAHPQFPKLILTLLSLAKSAKLAMSSYPPFPPISVPQTNQMLSEVLEPVGETWESVRLREGGMLRSLVTLILRGITYCPEDELAKLVQGLGFMLNGGSEQISFSAFSGAYKLNCETLLQDEAGFRYLAVFGNLITESGDLLYSEQFLVLLVFVQCTEIIYDRTEKGLDCTLLAGIVRELTRKYKLGQHLNALLSKETSQSIREIQDFYQRHPQLFPNVSKLLNHTESVFRYLEPFLSGSVEDDIELKNMQQQVKRLTLDLNKASNGSVEGIINILMMEEWKVRVHGYLLVQTSAKLQVLDKSLSRFQPAREVDFHLLEPHPDLLAKLTNEARNWKVSLFQRIHEREKAKDRSEVLERIYTKRRWRQLMKSVSAQKTGFWVGEKPSKFDSRLWKLASRFDREGRHFILQLDDHGSTHSEAINRKHIRDLGFSPPAKRRTMTSIDPADPEQMEMLKRLPMLPFEIEEGKTAPEPEKQTDFDEEPDSGSRQELTNESEPEKGNLEGEEAIMPVESVDSFIAVYSYYESQSPEDGFRLYECERICIKGAIFGKLELTPQFMLFKSTGEMKPAGQYFGSALSWSQVAVESEVIWDVREVQEVFRRRFHHLHTAVEIFLTSGKGYYFNCFSEQVSMEILQFLKQVLKLKVWLDPQKDFRQDRFTKDWQQGRISNYEYLTLLNKYASRTYNDLNQYPVFPWVLKDYQSPVLNISDPDVYRDLSKPIGAIDPVSLQESTKRYALWTEDLVMKPFHFGSHYSSGGIVLHYLVRMEPYATKAIELQDGTFDVADRLFFSLPTAYSGSIKGAGDVKELTPEFFHFPEFLMNVNGYELGKRQSGESVSDVELPKWARHAHDFIRQHRKALESLYVSENLHNWIDLIFGYKQWGEAAVEANNVFFCFTYEQHVAPLLKSSADTKSMEGLIEQIGQFGQTPVQLFETRHEHRLNSAPPSTFFDRMDRKLGGLIDVSQFSNVVEPDTQVVTVFALRSRFLIVENSLILKICKWRVGSVENNRPEISKSQGEVELSLENAFPYCGDFSLTSCAYALVWPYLISGLHWDNSFKMHEFETGKVVVSLVHHLDLVTCLSYNLGYLVSGSLDSTLGVWEVRVSKSKQVLIDSFPHLILLGHCSGVKQCQVSAVQRLVVSLGLDGSILVHSLHDGRCLHKIDQGEFEPGLIAFNGLGVIAACSREAKSVHIYTINGSTLDTSTRNDALYTARQLFFSASGDHAVLMCSSSILVLDVYSLELTEIPLECPAAAITLSSEDQSIVGVSRTGAFFRIDSECKRTKLDLRNLLDSQGFGKAFALD